MDHCMIRQVENDVLKEMLPYVGVIKELGQRNSLVNSVMRTCFFQLISFPSSRLFPSSG